MALTSITELTEGTIDGTGSFDKLMAAVRVHLDREFKENRLRGPEYAQVYLGLTEASMNQGMTWIIQGAKIDLERELLAQQVEMAKIQARIAEIELLKVGVELEMLQLQKPKVAAEVKLLEAQVVQMEAENTLIPKKAQLMEAEVLYKQKQGEMITSEIANSIKQGELIDSQVAKAAQEVLNAQAEGLNIPKQGAMIDMQKAHVEQQTSNLSAEAANIPKQGEILVAQKGQITQQTLNLTSEKLAIESRTALTTEQVANAVVERTVLVAQECKLRAEFDVLMNQMTKTSSEIALLVQKTLTEKAQTQAVGVDVDSVIGRQKTLYVAQTDGFKRDAEQKVAKTLIDTWNARRMTDEATVADGVNMLNDATIGRAVNKLLAGVGA